MREVELECPACGETVTVYHDQALGPGPCPECGEAIEVPPEQLEDLAEAGDEEQLMDLLDTEPVPTEEEPISDIELPETSDEQAEAPAPEPEERAEQAEQQQMPTTMPQGPPAEVAADQMDFRLWQGLAEQAGDWRMAVRLDAWRRAREAGCEMDLDLEEGSGGPIPRMILGEAALAAFQSQTEAEWRDEWTRRMLEVARRWDDDQPTREGVVEALKRCGPIVQHFRRASVWPWDEDGQPISQF